MSHNPATVTVVPSGFLGSRHLWISVACLASMLLLAPAFAVAAPITYTYDSLDRLIRAAYPDGTVVSYTYNAAGNLLTRSITGGATAAPPTVTTGSAGAVAATTATLNGTVSSNGASTTVTFPFGPTTGYGSSAAATQNPLPAAASGVPVSATLSGLDCNTTYHFRAVGVSTAGTANGADATFTTTACGSLNATGLWWNPDESGWGINFSHQGDIIFATWFTYDATGKPWWLIAVLAKSAPGVYAGPVSTVSGPLFNSSPFGPAPVEVEVGTMTATFTDAKHATLAYTVNASAQTKAIVPQAFGALPTCVWGQQPDLALATNYQDLWWNANESGWGVNFTHQGDIIFATWFTYDAQGKPWWLIAVLSKGAANSYSGPVSTVAGPLFNSAPFGPPPVETEIGTATVTFANGNAATFAYTVNGVAQTKAITRQVFVQPGTVCQ